jgi:hypothetical protein
VVIINMSSKYQVLKTIDSFSIFCLITMYLKFSRKSSDPIAILLDGS